MRRSRPSYRGTITRAPNAHGRPSIGRTDRHFGIREPVSLRTGLTRQIARSGALRRVPADLERRPCRCARLRWTVGASSTMTASPLSDSTNKQLAAIEELHSRFTANDIQYWLFGGWA